MRKDGYSGGKIEVKTGVNRSIIGHILREAGIVDTAYKADERYPLRCPKCEQFGHNGSNCKNGDALDQLDRSEGYRPGRVGIMTEQNFERVRTASSLGIPDDTIARELKISPHELRKAVLAGNYQQYRDK